MLSREMEGSVCTVSFTLDLEMCPFFVSPGILRDSSHKHSRPWVLHTDLAPIYQTHSLSPTDPRVPGKAMAHRLPQEAI